MQPQDQALWLEKPAACSQPPHRVDPTLAQPKPTTLPTAFLSGVPWIHWCRSHTLCVAVLFPIAARTIAASHGSKQPKCHLLSLEARTSKAGWQGWSLLEALQESLLPCLASCGKTMKEANLGATNKCRLMPPDAVCIGKPAKLGQEAGGFCGIKSKESGGEK